MGLNCAAVLCEKHSQLEVICITAREREREKIHNERCTQTDIETDTSISVFKCTLDMHI